MITGNRITAMGAQGSVTIPSGATRSGRRRRHDRARVSSTPTRISTTPGFEVLPETKWEYAANLAFGVTTVYDPSAPSLDVFEQGEMVEAGRMLGPRVYSSGDVLYGGQQATIYAEVDSQDDARRQVRRMKAYGARMIKVYQQPRRDQRLWFAQACREEHMLLTAEGAGELQTDLSMVIGRLHVVRARAAVRAPRRRRCSCSRERSTTYTPTLIVAYGGPEAEDYFYQTANPHDDEKLRRFVPHPMLDQLARRHRGSGLDEYHFPTVAEGGGRVVARAASSRWARTGSSRASARTGSCGRWRGRAARPAGRP